MICFPFHVWYSSIHIDLDLICERWGKVYFIYIRSYYKIAYSILKVYVDLCSIWAIREEKKSKRCENWYHQILWRLLCFITDKFYWSMHKDLKYIETWLSPFSNRKSENSWSDKKSSYLYKTEPFMGCANLSEIRWERKFLTNVKIFHFWRISLRLGGCLN